MNQRNVFIQCECFSEAIAVDKFDDEEEIYLTFWAMAWYSKNIIYNIKQRIKMAFHILWKGEYRYQEIILTKEKAIKLKELLEEYTK